MGTGADPGIFVAPPVDEVVPAFGAATGVVGDFIGVEAVLAADVLRDVVERARQCLVRRLELAGGMQTEKRRAFLDRQLIERKVLGGFCDREFQFAGPGLGGLIGAGIDQIEGIALERTARDRNRVQRLTRAMQTPEHLQRRIVQRLHAERDAVDAGAAIAGETRGFHTGGIGLQRHFSIGGDAPVFANRIQDCTDRLRPHQRGRAAAEKNRGDLAIRCAGRRGFDLARECARKTILVDRGMPDMAVEIAIGAFRQAKRPVHVNAESLAVVARTNQGSAPPV